MIMSLPTVRHFLDCFLGRFLPLLFGSMLGLIGCGYHLGSGDFLRCYKTISIPYMECDQDGIFTTALVHHLTSTTPLRYMTCGGELCLKTRLICPKEENIGFRYDIEKCGKLTRRAPWLIPTEARLWVSAEIELIDRTSEESLIGPLIVSVYIEFDHEYYLSRHGVNVFSLGQVTDIREANDAAQLPLARALAKKIVDTISYAW